MSKKKRGKKVQNDEDAFPPEDANQEHPAQEKADAGDDAAEASTAETRYTEQRGRGRSTKQIRATAMARDDSGMVALCDAILAGEHAEPGGEDNPATADDVEPGSDEANKAGLAAEAEAAQEAAATDSSGGNVALDGDDGHSASDDSEGSDAA